MADMKTVSADILDNLELRQKFANGGHHLVYGVTGSQRAMLLAAFVRDMDCPVLYIAADLREADVLLADFEFFYGGKGFLYPPRLVMAGEADAESHEVEIQRLAALEQVARGHSCLIVATAAAVMEPLPPPEHIRTRRLKLAPGVRRDPSEIALQLLQMGYQRVDQVEGPGQFSHRGEILDIFGATADEACRIQYFDVEIESIRTIDLETQRSRRQLSEFECGPARMLLVDDEIRARILERLDTAKVSALYQPRLDEDRERFANLHYWAGYQRYIQYMFDHIFTLPEYFADGLTVVSETPDLIKQLELYQSELIDRHKNLLESGKVLPDLQPYIPLADLIHRWQHVPTCHFGLLLRSAGSFTLSSLGSVPFRQVPSFYGQQQLLVDEVKAWLKRNSTVVIISPAPGEQLAVDLKEHDLPVNSSDKIVSGMVNLITGNLSSGFELLDPGLVVLTHGEISVRHRPKRVRQPAGMSAGDINSLKPGEYVVHSNYGIGQFMGVVTREIAGIKKDYLYIRYAGKDKLYLPTEQVQHLQRYVGGQDKPPKLYSLSGGDWQRVKKKVRESVQSLAFDLLKLYARRQAERGHAFAPDTPWQQELENSFPFQETPDQLRAIEEVKRDMELSQPMDRLLCGDVGYGKTEVALRAAMKAVMDGKQVAVLAPTTVLAQQHYRTFCERLAPFPIKVEVLSRFRGPQDQKQVVRAANAGTVDILIGTHRLLQKDIKLPELGLLIVDEEQRFGVGHKEQIKELKANIDVLTMTATPIPRTLHMALLGVRDLSVINTPPEGRFPVQTYVLEYADQLAVSAIRRELDRGGQIYLVYNRVQGIDSLAGRLRNLLPEVQIGVVHGQMAEGLMERTMVDFYDGKYNVLLSTTIIENGLDIPNVNTVFIYDADRLGLSQLYQLRGRVGRGRRLAYAYFTYRRDKVLSEKAQKRLAAIKEFTELGSGYKIALKDLEIRGAGNIIGPEQHGFISAVGFDLYCKLLDEKIKEITGQIAKQPAKTEVSIELPLSAYIPEAYLPEQEKIYVYRQVKDAESLSAIDELEGELTDRFGAPPQAVTNLLDVGRIRVLAGSIGIESISHAESKLTGESALRLEFAQNRGPDGEVLQKLWAKHRGQLDFKAGNGPLVTWKVEKNILGELEQLLHQFSKS
ncbi:MAG: transcription-repair coupling factor [Firmicutes bacterium]|nr:transcription-repair coupling factor [Bacillota bacterium]